MKKAKYFTVLGCISLMAFAQNSFESNMITNENTPEKMTFKNELFIKPNSINNDTINRTKVHYSFSIGTFIPTNNAKLIGIKPSFGGSFGLTHKQMTYDLSFDVRFGKTKNEYQLANGNITDHYLGGYVGIDIARDIWTNNKSQILIIGGVGLDVFEIVPGVYREPTFLEEILFGDDRITIEESKNIFSPNFNFGLMYRFYYNKKNYFGIRYKYNIVNYNSNKIFTDVTGNYHSITISFGGFIKND
jgi:hypothetical protein